MSPHKVAWLYATIAQPVSFSAKLSLVYPKNHELALPPFLLLVLPSKISGLKTKNKPNFYQPPVAHRFSTGFLMVFWFFMVLAKVHQSFSPQNNSSQPLICSSGRLEMALRREREDLALRHGELMHELRGSGRPGRGRVGLGKSGVFFYFFWGIWEKEE